MDAKSAVRAAVGETIKLADAAIEAGDAMAPCTWFNPCGGGCENCMVYDESGEGSRCFRLFIEDIAVVAAERAARMMEI